MSGNDQSSVERWVQRLSNAPIPVLTQTLERLAELKADEDNVRPRDLSQVVLHDPMLTLTVLRFLRRRRSNRMLADITTVEHAIMMLGVTPFFGFFDHLQSVDTLLRSDDAAMRGLLAVVARSRHAALHAREWAKIRHDVESDEVIIATLLHDMAEMLLWCFAPRLAERVQAQLDADHALRSADVQSGVLGFRFNELQMALSEVWDLPPLLTSLMDDFRADRPRARNVIIAVNLARHCAHGWEDAALPDDFADIRRLTGRGATEVRQRAYITALEAVRDQSWYGERAPAVWLPPYPLNIESDPVAAGAGVQNSQVLLRHVIHMLGKMDDHALLNGKDIQLREPVSAEALLPCSVALAMHGLFKGVGLGRLAYFSVHGDGTAARVQYLGAAPESGSLGRTELSLDVGEFPLLQALSSGGALWWHGAEDELPFASLPAAWRRAIHPHGFFLASLRSGDTLHGLLYADGAAGQALDAARFDSFRVIAGLLEKHIAAAHPAPPSSDAA